MKNEEVKPAPKVFIYMRLSREEDAERYISKEEKMRREYSKTANENLKKIFNQKIPKLLDRRVDNNGIF